MSVTDLRPKVRLLDQRAAKANLWSMGLWGISVVVLTCAVGVATWASFREPMDLVSVQIPPAIQFELSAAASSAQAAYPPGSIGSIVSGIAAGMLAFLRVVAITLFLLGTGVTVLTQRFAPAISGMVVMGVVAAMGFAIPSGGFGPNSEELNRIVVGIENRDYEDVRAAMMERSKRFPAAQEDYLWWQLAALSDRPKGVDFESILAHVETNATELQPTPGVRYALEKRALGSPISEDAKAFEKEALEAIRPWNGIAYVLLTLGTFIGAMALAGTVFARVLNRRVTRIASLGVSA